MFDLLLQAGGTAAGTAATAAGNGAGGLDYLAAGFGAGIALTGAAYGIGKLAAAAMEGSARQPEAMGGIRTSMIIAAALIEGLGFFALLVCLLLAVRA